MNRWKVAFWFCFMVLVGVSVLSVYTVIDQAVTLTYQKEGYKATENDLDQMIEIIHQTNLSKSEVMHELKDHRLSKFMDFGKDTISLERVRLVFEQNRLKSVSKEW